MTLAAGEEELKASRAWTVPAHEGIKASTGEKIKSSEYIMSRSSRGMPRKELRGGKSGVSARDRLVESPSPLDSV